MDIKSFNKKKDKVTEEVTEEVSNDNEQKAKKKINEMDNKILSKDDEIKKLKTQLSEARKINKIKVGDIRAEVNRQGDPKLICIGTNESGQREWVKANELTDADIERRKEYIRSIKQINAKRK